MAMTGNGANDTPVQSQVERDKTVATNEDREPTGGEIPVELVRCQSLDDFPQQSGVSRTNWIALI